MTARCGRFAGDACVRLGTAARELFERHVSRTADVASATSTSRRLLLETPLPIEDVGGGRVWQRTAGCARHSNGFPGAPRRCGTRPRAVLHACRATAVDTTADRVLRARAIRATLRDGVYRRTFSLNGVPSVLEVRPTEAGVELRLALHAAAAAPRVLARVSRLFDLDADASAIKAALVRDPRLARALRGRVVRVPGAFDAFEAGVRALLGQQISVAAARTLAGRLVVACGEPLATPDAVLTHVFPTPAAVAAAKLEKLGLTRSRAAALRGFAAAVADGTLDLGAFRDLDDAIGKLTALPGIGDWTAQYLAMRALGEPDAFPAGDLGVRQALAQNGTLPNERAVRQRAERWRPWRAYAVLALWTEPRTPASR
jgi:AraC family transcriptional regulator of adaptative response / DNA-3-methyladenine glycosylase II